MRPHLENPFTKIGLLEWLKVKALSSSPIPHIHKKKKKRREHFLTFNETSIALIPKSQRLHKETVAQYSL
jgi:hypothetical protein